MSPNNTLDNATADTTTRVDFPEKGFINKYGVRRTRRPSITLVVKRNVVAPILIRNTEDSRAETQSFNGKLHAQSNPEKFVSKERLTGLDLLRDLDDDNNLIHNEYAYNRPDNWEYALNLDPFTYGITGTGSDDFAIKSHVIEGYTYSTNEYELTNEETRNAAYETGTMKSHDNENGFDQSTALYGHSPIKPGNSFIHFITIEAALPGMVAYVLHNLLNTNTYGARSTRHGKNINNKVIGLIQADHEATLSTGELLMEYHNEDSKTITESITKYIADAEQDHWDIFLKGTNEYPNFPDWFTDLHDIASRNAEDATEQLKSILTKTTMKARSDIGE